MHSLSWTPGDLPVIVAVLSATVAYLLFHYGASAKGLRRALGCAQPTSVYAQRLIGGLLLGALPLIAVSLSLSDPSLRGFGLVPVAWGGAFVGVGFLALLPVLALSSRRPAHRASYPQARPERWTAREWATNATSWAIYLLGYELLFRGVLLFTLADALGSWVAIVISTGLYTLAHLPKHAGETAGCVVMGVAFGALALATGGMWAPFVLHLLIAVTSDSLSSRAIEPETGSRAGESGVGVEPSLAERRALELA